METLTGRAGYFDKLFAGDDDPWQYRDRWYERRKRAVTLAALPRERYRRGFEPGCANGELSAALAQRCDRLTCSDISARAVALARQRLLPYPWVDVEQRGVPGHWPAGDFDLLVISEMAYYLDSAALRTLIAQACACLAPDGSLVVCHWRHPIEPWALSAQGVHDAFAAAPGLYRVSAHAEEDFLLDVFSPDRRSVARREGFA